jgi:hypothetical protein
MGGTLRHRHGLFVCRVEFQSRDITKMKGLGWGHSWFQPYILGMFPTHGLYLS